MHTGVGATACASASQKCTGIAAALVMKPMNNSVIATITRGSARWPSSAAPICAMFSAPVRAYRSATPTNIAYAAMLFEIAKLIPPWIGPRSSILYAVSAYATAPISSKNTTRLKRSPVSENPAIAARNTSISAWKRPSAASK